MNELKEEILIPVIGLEIHVQLKTNSKLFCCCSTEKSINPNTNICPVCMGHPGSMPSLNKSAVLFALKFGIAANCNINNTSTFDRKNYFYPDLPKGFQITQERIPICDNGYIEFLDSNKNLTSLSINRIHLEEDAGKLIHTENETLVDFNRSGLPLVEIVTEPELCSATDSFFFLKELKLILEYLDISNCNMQDGSLRVDANISLLNNETKENYGRTEIKNLNSFNNVKDALYYEVIRQSELINNGQNINSETLKWDEKNKITVPTRDKISKSDYRFIPEPDLPNLLINDHQIFEIKKSLPELPSALRKRLTENYSLPLEKTEILLSSKNLVYYFEKVSEHCSSYESICNMIIGELFSLYKDKNHTLDDIKLNPKYFSELINLIDQNQISYLSAKEILSEIIDLNSSPKKIAEQKKLFQLSDKTLVENLTEEVLTENSLLVEKYKKGKVNLIGYFIGQVSKKTTKKIDPKLVKEVLIQKLNS